MVEMISIGKKISKRISASSLIEVTVSLVIITFVFSLSSVIYLNVQRSGLYYTRLRCEVFISEQFNSAVISKKFESAEFPYDDVTIYQEVKPYPGVEHLLWFKYEARDANGKLIAEQNHLIYALQ